MIEDKGPQGAQLFDPKRSEEYRGGGDAGGLGKRFDNAIQREAAEQAELTAAEQAELITNEKANENYRAAQARNAEKIANIEKDHADGKISLPEKLKLIEEIKFPMGVPGENIKNDEETNQAYREAKARIEEASGTKDGEDGIKKAA